MNTNILKDSLKEKDIIKLLKYLGADQYEEKVDAIIFPTICHNVDPSEASKKLYYYKKNKLFHCYTECGESFDIYGLFKRVYTLRQIQYNFYDDIYYKIINVLDYNEFQLIDNFEEKYNSIRKKFIREDKRVNLPEFDRRLLGIFTKKYPIEWLYEDISKESMDKYNIRYYISENKIVIPHYDASNRLVGIRGRQLNITNENIPKYMPIKIGDIIYSHPLSLNLYGLNISKDNIINRRKVILFEGEKSCLKYDSFFDDNISVAVCGSNFNKYQLELLFRICRPEEIIIAFDKEYTTPYCGDGEKYFNKLYSIGKKYEKYANFSFIYDKEGMLKYKDSPIDKGKDAFMKLYYERETIK